ncbi:MAG: hypothetical protein E7394_05000 [Ruminococcaceae bacterium]|nr:hypothetical protein [Oscillospiraceae bacterium]
MKKLISIFLCMMLMVSCIPLTGFSAENTDADIIQDTMEANTKNSSDESFARLQREESLAKRQMSLAESEKTNDFEDVAVSEGDFNLMATTSTMKVKVTFPTGTTTKNGDIVYVYLYTPPTIEDEMVVSEAQWYKSGKATLTGNESSVTVSISSVEYGSYVVGAKLRAGNKNVLSNIQYYSSSGTVISEAGAGAFKFSSSNKTVTLPLLKSESSISGTIDLSNCVPDADTTVNVSACIEEGSTYNYQYIDVPVKAGAKSVNYEMGLSNGNQYVRYTSSAFKAGYYFDGKLDNTWGKRTFFNLKSEHKTGLDVVAYPKSTGAENDYAVTVTLPYTPEDSEFFCGLTDGEDILADEWIYFEETDTVTVGLTPYDDYGEELYFFFKEVNPNEGVSYDIDESMRFYSEDRGITGNIEYATNVADMTEFTVEYPATYTISGSINPETGIAGGSYIYIGAEFDDDIFYTYVSESSGSYKIYVPRDFKNQQYRLFTATGTYGCMNSDSKEYGSTYTLSGNKTDANVTTDGARKITGVIYLPSAAPRSGLVVTIEYNDYDNDVYGSAGTCYIAPGETSRDFVALVPNSIPTESGCLEAEIEAMEPINISQMAYSMALEDNEDLWFSETVTLSGKIFLPNSVGTLDSSFTVEIQVNGNSFWEYGCATIFPGTTSADYAVKVDKDSTIRQICVYHQRNDIPIGRNYYYSSGGKLVSSWTETRIDVDDDMVINIAYPDSVSIKGTVTLPENGEYIDGEVSYRITCASLSTGTEYSKNFETTTPFEENEFSIIVDEEDSEYIISVYVRNSGNSSILEYSYNYYVSDTAMSSSYSQATSVSIDDGPFKLTFPVCELISGTVNFGNGCTITSGTIGLEVCAYSRSRNAYYYDNIEDIDSTEPVNYSIKVPGGEDEKYIVYVYAYYDSDETVTNIERYEDRYYTSQGMVRNEGEAEEVLPSSGIDLTISKYREITGKITVPSDYIYATPLSKVSVVLVDEDSNTYWFDGYVDENLNYSAHITDSYLENGDYEVYVYVESNQQNNILKDKEYYYQDANGNNKKVTVTDTGDITGVNVNVETGWAISGTVYLPSDAIVDNAIIDVRVRGHFDHWYGGEAGEISKEDSSIDYMFAVEKKATKFPVWADVEVYEYDEDMPYSTNVSEDRVYYVSKTSSTVDSSEATDIVVNGNVSGIDIYLKTGAVFEVEINYPSFANGTLNGYVTLVDEGGDEVGFKTFYMSEYEGKTQANIVVSQDCIGEKLYLYIESDSYNDDDPIYRSKVYINPDGTLTFGRSNATPFTVALINEVSYTPIKDDDSRIPKYEIESEHPYSPNTNETYTYNHPDSSVSKLYVTFNEESELEYGDYINVYDTLGNYVDGFNYYDDLSSHTFVVNDSGFEIVFESNGYSQAYGFAIESITESKTHTVVFKNYDGTVLKTYTVNHGESVNYDGPEPTKPAKPLHICEFNGWQGDGNTYCVEKDIIFTADFYEDAMYYIYFAGSEWDDENPYDVYVENCTGEDRKACFVVANYDSKGKLVDVELEEIDLYAYNNPVRNTGEPISEGGYVKIMLLDSISNLLPIAESDFMN